MPPDKPVVVFDGVCNYCNTMINFLLRQDKKKIFLFATLQSVFGQKVLRENHLPGDAFESFILIDKGKLYQKSAAGLRVYNKLPWYWKWTQLLWVFPEFLRDWIYDIIAQNRYRWFGKRTECMTPTPGLKERFLE
jgi:predicted DCC family thiol-disulfide oxidoreductase YuxK